MQQTEVRPHVHMLNFRYFEIKITAGLLNFTTYTFMGYQLYLQRKLSMMTVQNINKTWVVLSMLLAIVKRCIWQCDYRLGLSHSSSIISGL